MEADTSLKIGMTVQTLGYYEVNDGGGATYKVTNAASETEYQEELDNGLYANLIINKKIIVNNFGAYGDGIHDDTNAIQNAINYAYSLNNKNTVKLLNQTYLISNINIKTNVNLIGEGFKNTILKVKPHTEGNIISITEMNQNYIILKDFMIMGDKNNNTASNGIYIDKGENYVNSSDAFCTFENLLVSNIYGNGIYNWRGGRENRFKNIVVEYCNGYGIDSSSSDCYFEGITCKFNKKSGININSSACRFINIKCFLNGYNNSDDDREYISGYRVSGINNTFNSCDAQENYGDGFYIKNSYNSFINCLADANGFKSQRYNSDNTYADMTDEELVYDGFHIIDSGYTVKNSTFIILTSDHRRSSNHQLQRYGLSMGTLQNSTIIMSGYNNVKTLYYPSGFSVNVNYYGNNYVEVNGIIIGSAISNRLTLNNVSDTKNAIDIFVDTNNTKKVRFTNNSTNTFQIDNILNNTYKNTPFSILLSDVGNDGVINIGDSNKNYSASLRARTIGFFGKSPVAQQTTIANATDLASCIALANGLKNKLQNLGLIAEDE